MGLWTHVFLLGLLPLLGQGATQADTSPGENTLEDQLWTELQTLEGFPFLCNLETPGSNVPSKSVHSLRPSDIKFVAAIGDVDTLPDSGTAGTENHQRTGKRPEQVCMGVVTVLSEVVRRFSPSVLSPVCTPGKRVEPHSSAENLWIQAKELVRSMKESQQLDFHNDWKLINVFFSNTSRCRLCPSAQQEKDVMSGMDKLTRMLDYLLQEVPKAFVNLVDLSEVVGASPWHQETHLSSTGEPCGCSGETAKLSKVVTQWSYQESWERLLASSRYNEQEGFAAVFQPFLSQPALEPPSEQWPLEDPIALAVNLWNTMMEPAGQKDEPFNAREMRLVKCPSQENPYLFTYRNSNYLPRVSKIHEKLEVRDGTEIRCPDKEPSDTVPTSVHRLKLADIKVIAALGDSLTAGNGAGSKPGDISDVLTQYRGLSWSGGGDHNLSSVITVANILREFNPSLRGYSVGTGNEDSPGAFLNQAVAGDRAEGLSAQARRLVNLMKNDTRIDFQEDWKLITLFIGSNDLCTFCNDVAHYSPQNFTNNLGKALEILHAEVPRAFVNLVNVLEIINLRKLYQENKINCPRMILRNLCPCVLKFNDSSTELASLVEVNKKYQDRTHQLVESGRYDTREDFTVVVQPFFEKLDMPKTSEGLPDSSFFAPDCFHFSSKSHAHAASALWNNMLEPVGQKATQHNFESKINITCPNEDWPFLSTYKNSVQDHGSQLLCGDRAPSTTPPTSVHALRPADIQVVAALGDSLTAGNGIGSKPDDLADVATQYRGLSFSSGGDGSLETVTTLPNILRKFNRNLTGYAVGTGDANDTNAFLNQAVPGAKAEDLISQVQTLVQRMKDDQRVNFHEDWKVITVMIGENDLCDYCTDSNLYSASNFFDRLRNALDILHREVPRALVNLVDFMDPSVIRQVFLGNPDKCPVQQASILCNCALTPPENSQELARLEAITRAYQNSMRELVESGRYDTREDFSVVLQPFFHNIRLPVLEDGRPDMSFFAPDCIHPNQKFHSQLSRALWVNMLEPVGGKTETLNLTADLPLSCPTQKEPFLRTLRNSNYTYPTNPAIKNWGSDFLCTEWNPSNSVPTSVHELRPADIKVVAALGDSLTTASGARPGNSSDVLVSWRGLSWSAGGDGVLETHTTLPNILKKFNPNILGFSTGTQEETAGLNVALEEARARDMPAQARDLVERMKNSPEINLEKDWKLITLFIGINDLCHYCENPEAHLAGEYVQHIQQALDILYEELPRAFINMVVVMELTSLYQGQGGKCSIPLAAGNNCTCLTSSWENFLEIQELKKVNWNFQSDISRLSSWHQYLQRKDFTVVVQPFFQNTFVPLNERGDADHTFFSEDCFHFSERGHAEMAIALWNNMLEPVGSKTTSYDFTYSRTKLKCPSPESPYLYTLKNSRLLPDQAAAGPGALPWAVPVAAGGGLAVGISFMMAWRAIRGG
ncbi:phospholipase B1, membrane-associated [Rousettus aegyptiacus]|uniref:Phospholipase B1, membrane-associated n=2 Tax=Rousettus aegyptiacus TaxID=9407 RepID=A0A7J8FL37_ROUAE|nr:phospholipase B1, membrane-associated [Rousettus aegyptiacus]XP_016000831.2 phospholipase B1, membrane-associated [Rousettus aegyptiacus]XP_016000832.2 phospholipase B1, membrane-associated [Rousettus aegyptiacus]XP_016000833.2 phospholipase B1, membrane-associated [Rousettus aegyptiacus]XP_016000834.2 phospholipase B1, membrane-associated [Rousettus aegyptiacus]KAF6448376.1 phospholipase B1 [Rousettus aegyptiacus]